MPLTVYANLTISRPCDNLFMIGMFFLFSCNKLLTSHLVLFVLCCDF